MLYAGWEESSPPDPGPDSDEPLLEIVSLAISELGDQAISWDESSYAKIEVPRSKVPTKAEDFAIEVPEGVECEITKRELSLFHWLVRFVSPSREGDESTIWDIVLRSKADPSVEKRYALEIVPVDEGGDPAPNPPTDGTDPTPDPPAPPTGGDTDPTPNPPAGDPAPTPGDPQPMPQPTPPLGAGPDAPGAPDGSGSPNGEDGDHLAETGDDAPGMLLLMAGIGCLAALGACLAYRRRCRR